MSTDTAQDLPRLSVKALEVYRLLANRPPPPASLIFYSLKTLRRSHLSPSRAFSFALRLLLSGLTCRPPRRRTCPGRLLAPTPRRMRRPYFFSSFCCVSLHFYLPMGLRHFHRHPSPVGCAIASLVLPSLLVLPWYVFSCLVGPLLFPAVLSCSSYLILRTNTSHGVVASASLLFLFFQLFKMDSRSFSGCLSFFCVDCSA